VPYRPKVFVGIQLDKRVREKCAEIAARLQAQGLNARYEPAGKLHITLAFLGWVQPEQIEPIRDTLHVLASAVKPFTLTLDTIGAFPHERRPKIVWIGARDQGAPYRTLAYSARRAFEPMGFTFDKDAVAHVTVARVKGGQGHLPMLDIKPMHVHVTDVVLFESLPAGRTTRYEVRDHAPLNPNA
jgi:2'-5' RNA ligase